MRRSPLKGRVPYFHMRNVAYRLPLKEVAEAQKGEEGFITPSGLEVRRVSVWGVVARKFVSENHLMFILDDFTGTVPVYVFGEGASSLEIEEGDVIRVIGMIRERDGEPRIITEILRKIDTKEELLHRLENLLTVLRYGEEAEEVEVL
jgi:RPA family protein